MKTDIPAEQLKRITPQLDALLATLTGPLRRLPPDADSALVFQPDPEPAE
jgi:hypothetical protein